MSISHALLNYSHQMCGWMSNKPDWFTDSQMQIISGNAWNPSGYTRRC